jgi:hypothetical protein
MWARGRNRQIASDVRWEGEVVTLEGQSLFNAEGNVSSETSDVMSRMR